MWNAGQERKVQVLEIRIASPGKAICLFIRENTREGLPRSLTLSLLIAFYNLEYSGSILAVPTVGLVVLYEWLKQYLQVYFSVYIKWRKIVFFFLL